MISSSFDLVTGTDNNVLKGICSASQSFVNVTSLTEAKPTVEFTRLLWSEDSDCIYYGRNDGSFGKMSFKDPKLDNHESKLDDSIVGLDFIDKKKLLICSKQGTVQTFQTSKSALEKLELSPGSNLFSARLYAASPSRHLLATGGKENDLKLFDLSKKEPVFSAKNLANDWLSLQQPVWIRDLGFISAASTEQLPKMVTITDNGFLRVYDSKVQRRPVVNVSLVDHPLISLAVFPTPSSGPLPYIAAGSAQGWLGIVDLRQPKAAIGKPMPGNCQTKHRLHGRCRGVTGSVRTLVCLPRKNGMPLLASAGLDRFVRVFDTSLPKSGPMAKIYCKSKLSALAFNPKTDVDKLFEALSLIDHTPQKPKRPKYEPEDDVNHLPDLVIDGSDDEDADDDDDEGHDGEDSEGVEVDDDDDEDEEDDDSEGSVEDCGSVDLDDFDKKPSGNNKRKWNRR